MPSSRIAAFATLLLVLVFPFTGATASNFCSNLPEKLSDTAAAVDSAASAVAAAAEALQKAKEAHDELLKDVTAKCLDLFGTTEYPSSVPSGDRGGNESSNQSAAPSIQPSAFPSVPPSAFPSIQPSAFPSIPPSAFPSIPPSTIPSIPPSAFPSVLPSAVPSVLQSATAAAPSVLPSTVPSSPPSAIPTDDLADIGACTICGPTGPSDPDHPIISGFNCGMFAFFIPSQHNATDPLCGFYRAIGDHACGCNDNGDIPGCEGILGRCPQGKFFDLNRTMMMGENNPTDCATLLFFLSVGEEESGMSCSKDEGSILEACCSDGLGPAPSAVPSISEAPSVSHLPSVSPTQSRSPLRAPSFNPTSNPSGEPTSTPSIYGCRTKRLVVTHLCSMPDLDGGESDDEMAIRLEVAGKQVWPAGDVRSVCPNGRSYGSEWCKVWDYEVMNGCYTLDPDATAEVTYHVRPPGTKVELTLFEEDFFFDDDVSFSIPVDDLYDYERCGVDTFNATTYQYPNAHIVVRVTSDVRVPTMLPSVLPTAVPSTNPSANPTHPTPTPSYVPTDIPSFFPSQSPTSQCGVETDSVEIGLADATEQLLEVNQIFRFNDNDVLGSDGNGRRRLAWPLMSAGVKLFRKGFSLTKSKAGEQGPLSTVADICTIGSTLFSVFGLGGGEPPDPYADEFRRIFERFDQIDAKLDDISDSIETGFERMEVIIKQEFANEFLDGVIKGRLAELEDNYRAYLDPEHLANTREIYETIFRDNCRDDSPYTILKSLYGHTCRDCDLLDGRFNQYILDTFVDLAIERFDDIGQRVLWFRSSFTTMMLGSAIKTVFLHSVCLYQPRDVCQNQDPVWKDRLDAMGNALEEMADSLSAAEDRVKCRKKSVRVTHMCNIPDLDPDFILYDDDMDLRLEIEGQRYWPMSVDDCTDNLGMFNNACLIKDAKLVNGKCYHLQKSTYRDFSAGQRLDIKIVDEDIGSFDEVIYFSAPSADWYDDMSCDDRDVTVYGEQGSYLKLNIKSSVINEPFG